MKRLLLIIALLGVSNNLQAQKRNHTPVLGLSTTREMAGQGVWDSRSSQDTIFSRPSFLGLNGHWVVMFDKTDSPRRKSDHPRACDWYYEFSRDTNSLQTVTSRLIEAYGLPTRMEEGSLLKASWYRGDTVILLVHVSRTNEVSVHWRYTSDMPIHSVGTFLHNGRSLELATGRELGGDSLDLPFLPILDLTVTRDQMKRLCPNCMNAASGDTLRIWTRIAGLPGSWVIVFDSTDRHRESSWTTTAWVNNTVVERVMRELRHLYGTPQLVNGPVIKAIWHHDETAIVLTHLSESGETAVHWRYKSDMPLRWIEPYNSNERIDVATGVTMSWEETIQRYRE